MDKKVLNERLNELIRQIRLNSKDAHFAEKLTEDLLTVHRQKLHEKSYVFDIGDELNRINKNSYYLAKHERGVVFHVYNSFDLVVPIAHNSLYKTLSQIFYEYENKYSSMSEEDKVNFDTYVEAVGVVLVMPLNIFMDVEFTIDIATRVLQKADEMYKASMEAPLQNEEVDKDIEFAEVAISGDSLARNLSEGVEALSKQQNG